MGPDVMIMGSTSLTAVIVMISVNTSCIIIIVINMNYMFISSIIIRIIIIIVISVHYDHYYELLRYMLQQTPLHPSTVQETQTKTSFNLKLLGTMYFTYVRYF